MQAVILAAGKGLRLRPVSGDTPKPLVRVGDQTLLDHAIDSLPACIDEMIVVTGYKTDLVERHLDQHHADRDVACVQQTPVDGTGSAIHAAKDLLSGSFLVINSDDLYSRDDLARLCEFDAAILTLEVSHNADIRSVVCDKNHHFSKLSRTPPVPQPMRQSCGAYVIDESFFEIPLETITSHGKTEYSLPDTLEVYAKNHPVEVVEATFWMPVGTPEQLKRAENYLQNNNVAT
jgi:NDP-sugar pyrophosphorylase family protein